MTIYQKLNELDMDLEQYAEQDLSHFEKKQWEKRVRKKVKKQSPSKGRKYVSVAAAMLMLLATGISLSTGIVSIANMPFVGETIEKYLNQNENLDFSSYKTAIGQTAENEKGKLTLNEVMIDGGRLLISSTYEPADGIDFHHKMHPMPKVKMNGKNLTSSTGGQSIELNNSMFTVFNEVQLKEIPIGEKVQFHIEYDRLDLELKMNQPWVFDIEVPTEKLAADSKTITLDQNIQLDNGRSIKLEKMIVTPISTVLYYDWPGEENHIAFKIVSKSGTEILPDSVSVSPEESYNRFSAIDLESEKYVVVPFEHSENPGADQPDRIPELSVPIN
ncbi:DUF4179 domain-containing protein [Fictibacillus sp. 5RED26]|uniref:DUF4179 domain-containing protein n=1 Tax=Fictibacillus sp. 5RED26 TaxID=2745876 RepID=UPI0018CE2977|nr:DUF4179 domain-containing protein [Fictibacillus sp. 5RED26]MBH0156754.1 DUF4179 domain-containing protein [Fictibacillus sp. 5RED26]